MALSDILRYPNWVDIFIIIVLVKIGYTALKTSLPIEFFKLLGTILAVYLSLHYYIALLAIIGNFKGIAAESISLLFLIILALLGYFVFVFLRRIILRLINIEAENQINVWGGFILGMARGVLSVSLIVYILVISPINYLRTSALNAYSAKYLVKAAPATYGFLWNKIMSKFMAKEEINENVFEVTAEPRKK